MHDAQCTLSVLGSLCTAYVCPNPMTGYLNALSTCQHMPMHACAGTASRPQRGGAASALSCFSSASIARCVIRDFADVLLHAQHAWGSALQRFADSALMTSESRM